MDYDFFTYMCSVFSFFLFLCFSFFFCGACRRTCYLSTLSIFICSESTKHKNCGKRIQRTGQWDHNGVEHCPKYI